MGENIFFDLAEWWLSEHASRKELPFEKAFQTALTFLGIKENGEVVISKRVLQDWYADSEETYTSVVAIDLGDEVRVRTVMIAAYAIVTPPGIPIEERINIWKTRTEKLINAGVTVPEWYLTWKGTIYTQYPHLDLVEYIKRKDLVISEVKELAESLSTTLRGLASLSLQPLGLPYRLRTDSFRVYFCGMGFDVGESTDIPASELLMKYEDMILPYLSEIFIKLYKQITRSV